MANRFQLQVDDIPEQMHDFILLGAAKMNGAVSLILSDSNSVGGGFVFLSDKDRQSLIEVLSKPEKLNECM